MNPEDDPEARIRQLEQPLADAARASELGSSQPAGESAYQNYQGYPGYQPPPGSVPPSPPPYGYQPAFPGATPRSSSGNRAFWIIAAVFVVGILGAVAAVALFAVNRVSEPFTTLSPGTTVISTPPGPMSPGNKTQTPTAGPSTSAGPPAGSTISVVGVNQSQTITCNDNIVTSAECPTRSPSPATAPAFRCLGCRTRSPSRPPTASRPRDSTTR
ncbi:Cell division protein [Mycobacterium sp. 012931]|nr:Cell division protein [Mycobacterium sp. 012931]MBC9861214.1 putative membrane protein [Mycobacterium pseudoshottsii]